MNTLKRILIFVLISALSCIFSNLTDSKSVYAEGAAPYFSIESTSEMNRISEAAVNPEYNRGYYMAPEKNLEKIYKITITKKGYLTFTANNPYKSVYNTTLKTTLGLLDSSGHCLWLHDYDYNYESSELHSYRIGLDTGDYFFYLRNNNHYLKNAYVSLLYNLKFTESNKFETEPNNTPAMAKEYTFGDTIEGEYGCRTESIYPSGIADDYYELHLVKGRSYDITFEMLHKGFNRTAFYIENNNGKKIINAGNLVSNNYTYKCNKTGTYYLHVGNIGPSAISIVQPYTFKITENFSSPKTKITKVVRKGKNASITWKKASGVTGYQIQYGTNKKTISNNKLITIFDSNRTKLKITKLKKKKTYYVRIRTFTKSYNKTVKSSFSKIIKISKPAAGTKK